MAILDLPIILPAQVGTHPIIKRMVVSDNLATLTAAGFLNSSNLQSSSVSAGELIDVTYNADARTKAGPTVRCEVTIVANQVVLVPESNGYRTVSKVTAELASGTSTYVVIDADLAATSIVVVSAIAHGGAEAAETPLNVLPAAGQVTIEMTGSTTGTVKFGYIASILK